MVEYNFEGNQYYKNKNTPNYVTPENFTDPEIQFIQSFKQLDFDTHVTNNLTFQVTGEPDKLKKIYVNFNATKYYPIYTSTEPESYVDYVIDNDPTLTNNML